MGKDLHKSIISFLKERLNTHKAVADYEDISNDEYYMFKIIRTEERSDVIVLISDCYYLSEFDYLSKSSILNEGGIILIGKPEATFSNDEQVNEIDDKIIIGKIGILLGALHREEYWRYIKSRKKKEEQ